MIWTEVVLVLSLVLEGGVGGRREDSPAAGRSRRWAAPSGSAAGPAVCSETGCCTSARERTSAPARKARKGEQALWGGAASAAGPSTGRFKA